jgi:hypothetical protein
VRRALESDNRTARSTGPDAAQRETRGQPGERAITCRAPEEQCSGPVKLSLSRALSRTSPRVLTAVCLSEIVPRAMTCAVNKEIELRTTMVCE